MYCKTPIVQKAFHVWLYVQSSNNTNTTGGSQIVGNTNENVETTAADFVGMKLGTSIQKTLQQRGTQLKTSGNKPDLINIMNSKMCSLGGGDFRNQFSDFGLYVMPTHG